MTEAYFVNTYCFGFHKQTLLYIKAGISCFVNKDKGAYAFMNKRVF